MDSGACEGWGGVGGYSPWGSKELDATEHIGTLMFTEYLIFVQIFKKITFHWIISCHLYNTIYALPVGKLRHRETE